MSGTSVASTSSDGNITDPPLFKDYTADGDCSNDVLLLDPASTLIDAGYRAIADADGTTSAIGAYGGPGAHLIDADGDGYYDVEDCDDGDAGVNPGEVDIVGDGIDQDCSGDHAEEFVDTGTPGNSGPHADSGTNSDTGHSDKTGETDETGPRPPDSDSSPDTDSDIPPDSDPVDSDPTDSTAPTDSDTPTDSPSDTGEPTGSGCECSTGPSDPAGPALGLLVLGLAALRRR